MTDTADAVDALFEEAVRAVDAGDLAALERILAANPDLASLRLEQPGAWLREKIGAAADGFFARPYLLWFVAEDPVRHGRLPVNIGDVARAIIRAARRARAANLQEQLDYALSLVSWSWIARESGVQIELLDVLIEAGAALAGNPENALVNGNVAAAEHLVARGAPLSVATAVCLDRLDDAARLAAAAGSREKQFALVLAALNGKADGLRLLLEHGADPNRPSDGLYAHGTPLHHAVCSGRIEAVRVLVEAGASLDARDTVHGGTPLDWAQHYEHEHAGRPRAAAYAAISACLRRATGEES